MDFSHLPMYAYPLLVPIAAAGSPSFIKMSIPYLLIMLTKKVVSCVRNLLLGITYSKFAMSMLPISLLTQHRFLNLYIRLWILTFRAFFVVILIQWLIRTRIAMGVILTTGLARSIISCLPTIMSTIEMCGAYTTLIQQLSLGTVLILLKHLD